MLPQQETIRVLTLADSRYAMPLAVMVRSLLENRADRGRAVEVTIVDGGISAADKARLFESWRGVDDGASFRFVPHVTGGAGRFPVWGRIPAITYARLMLDAYFGGQGGRVLVLDSDMLVLAGVEALQDVELADAVLGACVDPFIPVVSAVDGLGNWREAGLRGDDPYFNAGMMVIDLDRWRAMDVTAQTLEFIQREHMRLRQYDQDALNAVLHYRWKHLDARWHCHPRTGNSLGSEWPEDPWIIHFSGRLKPWLYRGSHAADERFFEYLQRTAWRGTSPPRYDWTALGYRIYDSPVRRWLHPLESRLTAWQRQIAIARATKVK
jgi:lipopolysaccharide biosynthesis glycosyltransferase